LTGAGAGWAKADDETTSEAAIIAIRERLDDGIGIKVTGSGQEEAVVCTACRQDLRKIYPPLYPPFQR
jgi:hypothetical protein